MSESGRKARKLLRDAGVSQAEAGRRMGVSRAYVNRICSGAANPSLNVLARLATALGCRPGELDERLK